VGWTTVVEDVAGGDVSFVTVVEVWRSHAARPTAATMATTGIMFFIGCLL
jgi:hypothetical protein